MSEQARTVFNIEEQKAKDVMAAIKVVQPVLSIIRKWGKVTKEYTQLTEDNLKLSEEIASIKKVIELTCSGLSLEEDLNKILNNKSSEYEKSKKREEELKKISSDMEKDVLLYQEYAKLFNWIDHCIIEKVLNLHNYEDKEEYLSMMFLIFNAGISEQNLYPLKCCTMLREKHQHYYVRVNCGWNWMLNKLLLNEL